VSVEKTGTNNASNVMQINMKWKLFFNEYRFSKKLTGRWECKNRFIEDAGTECWACGTGSVHTVL